jgi:hypothetical protein
VGVRVDAPGHHQQTVRYDDLRALSVQVHADLLYLAVMNQHIAAKVAASVRPNGNKSSSLQVIIDDSTALDEQPLARLGHADTVTQNGTELCFMTNTSVPLDTR